VKAHPFQNRSRNCNATVEGYRSTRLDSPTASLAGNGRMIQITAQMRVLVAIEAVDGRKGIDSLMRLCQEKLDQATGGI
jgi:hypothetical protein